jgi:cytochrome c
MRFCLICLLWCVMLVGAAPGRSPAHAQLRGHGGPIRALAVSADGTTAFSGSFDTSAIRWSLRHDVAEQVLRLHDRAVNAVAILNGGRAVTAGADAIIGIWTPGKPVPDEILKGPRGRSSRSRYRPMVRRSPRRHGIERFAYGRSSMARRSHWKATSKT